MRHPLRAGLAIAALAGVFLAGCGRRRAEPEVEIVRQAAIPEKLATASFSRSGHHIAFTVEGEKTGRAIVDGREERPYDGVTNVDFAPNGEHYFYGGQRGETWFLVRDGREIAELGSLTNLSGVNRMIDLIGGDFRIRISSTLAIWFAKESDSYLVLAYKGQTGRIFRDRSWLPIEYGSFWHEGMAWSDDGRHYSFAVAPLGNSIPTMYLDGRPGPTAESIDSATYLQPGNKLIYRLKRGDTWTLMAGTEPLPGWGPLVGALLVSRDRRHIAGLTRKPDGRQAVVVDGAEGPAFPSVSWEMGGGAFGLGATGSFSWNSKATAHAHLATLGPEDNGATAVVLNGKVIDRQPKIRERSLAVSDDGRAVAYAVQFDKQWAIAVNGVVQARYEEVGDPVFPRDSAQPVYAAKTAGGWTLQGLAQPMTYAGVGPLVAVPAGRVAYAAKLAGGKWQVFLSGKPLGKAYEGILSSPPPRFIDDESELSFIAKEGNRLIWISVLF
ncbi:MAG: hypothetical protein ABSD27_07595 [Bryobacteraceae bacterium]